MRDSNSANGLFVYFCIMKTDVNIAFGKRVTKYPKHLALQKENCLTINKLKYYGKN